MTYPLISPRKLLTAMQERIDDLRIQPAVGESQLADLAAAQELERILIKAKAGDFDHDPGLDNLFRRPGGVTGGDNAPR